MPWPILVPEVGQDQMNSVFFRSDLPCMWLFPRTSSLPGSTEKEHTWCRRHGEGAR